MIVPCNVERFRDYMVEMVPLYKQLSCQKSMPYMSYIPSYVPKEYKDGKNCTHKHCYIRGECDKRTQVWDLLKCFQNRKDTEKTLPCGELHNCNICTISFKTLKNLKKHIPRIRNFLTGVIYKPCGSTRGEEGVRKIST